MSPPPPTDLLADAALFLDFDGTLVDIADRPDAVVVDDGLRALLRQLDDALGGRLAIVSGRSIAQLDAMLGPVAADLALVGSHGAEHRSQALTERPARPESLIAAARGLQDFAAAHPGLLVEEKSYGVALHYRAWPEGEHDALALAETIAREAELTVQNGKMMVEIRTSGSDKGGAVRRLMALPPMAGATPVFVGDDRTDEHGFTAARDLGGAGVLVGEARDTAAGYRLDDPAAVRAWLEAVA